MYLTNPSRAKNLRRTKDEPRMNLRTLKHKKCCLLRLPSLLPLLYLALFYRENSASTPCLQKVLFLKIAFLKKLSPFLKRLTKYLKRLTQHLTKFTHFEVYFAVPPSKFSRLYTIHFTPYTRKNTPKNDFSCTSRKKSVSLRAELQQL